MEERVTETREAYPATKLTIPQSIESEMADGTWMARNQLLKPVQIAQVDWLTTQERGRDILKVDYPALLGENESLVYRTLRMYAFYKLSPCFRIQINATVFHQGQLICAFDPFSFTDSAFATNYEYSHISATGLPNVKIMASHSDAVELKLPYTHPRSYLTTNTPLAYNNMGTLHITILNPLVAAEGASNRLTVTVWAYAENAEVHVPIADHDPILEFSAPEPPELVETSFSTIMDGVGKLPGHITDIFGNLMSGNFGQALRKGQGLVDTLGDMFGFDYPARTLQPPKTITPLENLALAKGVSQSQRLALDPFSMHGLDDDVAAESRESMNLKRIAQMPMLLTQFPFSGTEPAGTLLKTIYVNPCVSPYIDGSIQRTFLSYVANGFVYWAGGIIYDIEIVATKFHSGKLIFAYVPNTQEVPTYAAATDSLPNVIVDIQQTSSVRFVVPFTSSTSMKATFAPIDNLNNLNFVDSCTGTLVCYVQNVLAYASNVSASIEINVYVSAAPDMSFYVPQRPVRDRDNTSSFAKLNKPKLQETSILLNTNKNEQPDSSVTLSLGKGLSSHRNHFGEDYSLLDLVKRFSPVDSLSFRLNTDVLADTKNVLNNPNYFANNDISSSYLSYWTQLYSCWSGSLRYKFLARTNKASEASLSVLHVPTTAALDIPDPSRQDIALADFVYGGFGMTKTQLMQDCGVEVELPYYSRYNMLFTNLGFENFFAPILLDMNCNGSMLVTLSQPLVTDTTNVEVDVFVAAGDDFRLIYVRAPPKDTTKSILTIDTL